MWAESWHIILCVILYNFPDSELASNLSVFCVLIIIRRRKVTFLFQDFFFSIILVVHGVRQGLRRALRRYSVYAAFAFIFITIRGFSPLPLGDRLEALITFPSKAFPRCARDTGDGKIDAFKFDRADRKVAGARRCYRSSWGIYNGSLAVLLLLDSCTVGLFISTSIPELLVCIMQLPRTFQLHFYNFFFYCLYISLST